MSIIRVKHNRENPYVCISREAAQDSSLTLEAKGLLTDLLSRPDGWEIHTEALTRISPNAKHDKITRILDELMVAGYVRRERIKDEKGYWLWISEVLEFPLPVEERQINAMNRPKKGRAQQPGADQPDPGNPDPENPGLENPALEMSGPNRVQIPRSTDFKNPLTPQGEAAAPPVAEIGEQPQPRKRRTSTKPPREKEPTHPDFAAVKALLAQSAFGDPEMRFSPKHEHIQMANTVKEMLDLHGSIGRIQDLYAAVRRQPFWDKQTSIHHKKLAELFGRAEIQQAADRARTPTPVARPAAPGAVQTQPLNPAQQKAADQLDKTLIRVQELIGAQPPTVADLQAYLVSPNSTSFSRAYHHPYTHQRFLDVIGFTPEAAEAVFKTPPRLLW